MNRKKRVTPYRSNLPASEEVMGTLLQRSGISLSSHQLGLLWAYHQLLREYNPELNLTRIHNFENMVLKLYVDSILPGQLIELPSPLLDLGTGPGMPGIPLKIAFPHLEILLAESRRKRNDFLEIVVDRLGLHGLSVIGQGITMAFEQPVSGVITRAVEEIPETLQRISGCLAHDGVVIFMKGPQCDQEVQRAGDRFARAFHLILDHPYRIPHTTHERRLVAFRRLDEPPWAIRARAMDRHMMRAIESEHNERFKDLKKLLSARGIRKQHQALVFGQKQVHEILSRFPQRCKAWISHGAQEAPPPDAPPHLEWLQLASPLFQVLDVFGTNFSLLLIEVPPLSVWDPASGLPKGCSVLIPFQDPENVGAVIRSAVAFGVDQVILLAKSAHPYHPKALRASGGAVLQIKILEGPALEDLPDGLPLIPLSAEGRDLSALTFPEQFGLLPGLEGPGLPERWRTEAISIPIRPEVESLNAATATAIALYAWSQSAQDRNGRNRP